MRHIRLRFIAVAFSFLLASPFHLFAQISGSSVVAPDNSAVASSSAPAVLSLEELGLPAAQDQTPANAQDQKTPPANNEPSLSDLGFAANQTQGSAQQQARLNKRTHMLKVHQTLGLITLIPMVAAVATGGGAKIKKDSPPGTQPNATNLDLHVALGAVTGGMYAATAYYAIFAPKIPGTETRGAIRLHKYLEWVQGPGMVATGVLGILAYNQEKNGQRVHGVASAHGTVADLTVAAYAASIVAVSWPIKLKFWEGR